MTRQENERAGEGKRDEASSVRDEDTRMKDAATRVYLCSLFTAFLSEIDPFKSLKLVKENKATVC